MATATDRRLQGPRVKAELGRMKIAMLAPPWITVPPPGYGGIESVVDLLCKGLVQRGHDVTLFAAPGSTSCATVQPVLDSTHPDEIDMAQHESDHVAQAFAAIESDGTFGVIHDHCAFTAMAMADRIGVPSVHTVHGPVDSGNVAFYRNHWDKVRTVAISESQRASAPADLRFDAVVPNPIDPMQWPLEPGKDDNLLWVGRVTSVKGPHRAIAVARAADCPLVLAGPVQPGHQQFFESRVAPHIDGDAVRYVGEVGGAVKRDLFARARALLMPISWPEPFGMVMTEAMICGTPVIAYPLGAACDIVVHGLTGFLAQDQDEMARYVAQLDTIDPVACRSETAEKFSYEKVAAAYETVYFKAQTSISRGSHGGGRIVKRRPSVASTMTKGT